jgi:hypothetical protein
MPSICQEDGQGRKEEVEAHHQELPHLHQAQPQEQDQEQRLRYQEEGYGKVVAHKVGKMKKERGWNQPICVPKEVIINIKGPQMVWVPKVT